MKVKTGIMSVCCVAILGAAGAVAAEEPIQAIAPVKACRLYTSDAADERVRV